MSILDPLPGIFMRQKCDEHHNTMSMMLKSDATTKVASPASKMSNFLATVFKIRNGPASTLRDPYATYLHVCGHVTKHQYRQQRCSAAHFSNSLPQINVNYIKDNEYKYSTCFGISDWLWHDLPTPKQT